MDVKQQLEFLDGNTVDGKNHAPDMANISNIPYIFLKFPTTYKSGGAGEGVDVAGCL